MIKQIPICLLLSVCLITALPAHAQQPKKVPRIGYLAPRNQAAESTRSQAIRLALRELGYIDGQNVAFEYRYGEESAIGILYLPPSLCVSRLRSIVVSGGDQTVLAAKNATNTIPIVMVGGGIDPVRAGLIESLARPGGNITGVTNLLIQLGGKRLELLKQAVPKLLRVAVLYDPTVTLAALGVKEVLPGAARGLGLTIQPWEVRAADEFERVFAAPSKERPDGLYVPAGPASKF